MKEAPSPWQCPDCGSAHVDRVDVAGTPTESFIKLRCRGCGYEAWENEEFAFVYWGTKEEKAAVRLPRPPPARSPPDKTLAPRKKATSAAGTAGRKARADRLAAEKTERKIEFIDESELRCPKCGGEDVDNRQRIAPQSGNSADFINFVCKTCGHHEDLVDGNTRASNCAWLRERAGG